MGRRLCEESALLAAVTKSGFPHLFGSALLRHGRGEKLFTIVGDENGLKAVAYDVEGIHPEKITLRNKQVLEGTRITKWFHKAAERKRSCGDVEPDDREATHLQAYNAMELDDHTLRHLASQAFPGSLFYDVFINKGDHVFNALPPVGGDDPANQASTALA
ncbi:MAG: hypothetical protein NTU97_04070 [Candidatus Magasanikbacteria bacterium]|nr:hypothetical protein [Candidatus Magasanikbacteria bacterium]